MCKVNALNFQQNKNNRIRIREDKHSQQNQNKRHPVIKFICNCHYFRRNTNTLTVSDLQVTCYVFTIHEKVRKSF